MKKLVSLLFICSAINIIWSQELADNTKSGDLFIINKTNNQPFEHIFFPKSNFIIKRGGIANYKGLDETTVRVESLFKGKNNDLFVNLRPLGSKKFFNIYANVEANLTKALERKELIVPTKTKQESLVQQE